MKFLYPNILWLLILCPLLIGYYIWTLKKQKSTLLLSTASRFESKNWKTFGLHFCFFLEILGLIFLITALARPQNQDSWKKDSIEGIDIILAIDASGSMKAMDLQPDRFSAAINVAQTFISQRPNDNIGLVLFAGQSFSKCPLTNNHSSLLKQLSECKMGILEDGTAIGLGITTACNRLRKSKSKSRVIILLTDGTNNRGSITPSMATSFAKELGIRIYTIAVGTHGEAPYPIETAFGTMTDYIKVEIDENSLKEIAKETNGKFFRAINNKSLEEVYKEIDMLEKSKLMTENFHSYEELFQIWVLLSIICIAFSFILRHTIFRTFS